MEDKRIISIFFITMRFVFLLLWRHCAIVLGPEVNLRYASSLSWSPPDNDWFRKGFVGVYFARSFLMWHSRNVCSIRHALWRKVGGKSFFVEGNQQHSAWKQTKYSTYIYLLFWVIDQPIKYTGRWNKNHWKISNKFIVYEYWTSPRIDIFLHFINFLFLTDSRAQTPVSIQSRPRQLPLPAEIHGR